MKEYNEIKNDYSLNSEYFKNMAIIEGIRNSIAHGHYEFIFNGNFDETIMVFSDLYEGKLTFQTKISFSDFEKFIENNNKVVINFVKDKINKKNDNILIRK